MKFYTFLALFFLLFTKSLYAKYEVEDTTSFEPIHCSPIASCLSEAKAGNVVVQTALALRLLEGRGINEDKQKAFDWAMAAAKKDYAPALLLVGLMLANGDGVKKVDNKLAVVYFEKAAALKLAKAYHHLGMMYLTGIGVENDDVKAYQLFREAAKRGDVDGQLQLGQLYVEGRGTKKDVAKGRAWIRKAKRACRGDMDNHFTPIGR